MAEDRYKKVLMKELKRQRLWVQAQAEIQKRMGVSGAEQSFAEEDKWKQTRVIPVDLLSLSAYYGNCGQVGVIGGQADGWRNMDCALLCRYWIARLHAAAFEYGVAHGKRLDNLRLDLDVMQVACVLCYSLVYGLKNWSREMQNILLYVSATPIATCPGFWQERIFEPFAMHLYQRAFGGELPKEVQDRDMAHYGEVLAHWSDPSALAEPLARLCNYHITKMDGNVGGWLREFDSSPFELFPVEILAIYKVRERLGLETPIIDHPLLSTPLASLAPREVVPIVDPIIQRVEKLYHGFFDARG